MGSILTKNLLRTIRRILRGSPIITLDYPYRIRARYGYGVPPHPGLFRIVQAGHTNYQRLIAKMYELQPSLEKIPKASTDGSANWENKFFTGSDAAALYALLCQHNPSNFVEIGSGNSTKFARHAIDNNKLKTRITCIDPAPRADITRVADVVLHFGLQEDDLSVFKNLKSGDFVSLDGSHYCYQNSDTAVFFLEVLPNLPKGVLVHLHDIRIPNDYPDKIRHLWYGEQYMLATWLLARQKVSVAWCAAYVAEHLHDSLPPVLEGKGGSSFWFWTD